MSNIDELQTAGAPHVSLYELCDSKTLFALQQVTVTVSMKKYLLLYNCITFRKLIDINLSLVHLGTAIASVCVCLCVLMNEMINCQAGSSDTIYA